MIDDLNTVHVNGWHIELSGPLGVHHLSRKPPFPGSCYACLGLQRLGQSQPKCSPRHHQVQVLPVKCKAK